MKEHARVEGEPANRSRLAGLHVLVTRPEAQSEALLGRLRALGAEPVVCPTIRIEGLADFGPLDEAIGRLSGYDWAIFTSVNGVRFFFERLATLGAGMEALRSPARGAGMDALRTPALRLAAIGPATAQALEAQGLQVAFVPSRYVAEAILEEIGPVAGLHILLPRADIARKALADGLRAQGALVDEVSAYRTVAAAGEEPMLPAGLAEGVDIATFTSPSTVHGFLALLEAAGRPVGQVLAGAKIACIGPITARAAQEAGLRVDIVAPEHTVEGLLNAINEGLD
jgi:uroporphyrinogen-III synthase